MICTPSLASCITGSIFSLIADTCIHKGLKLSTSSNKFMSVMLVPGWASVINEARSSISDAWSSIPWTMITGLKQNVFVRDKNKSAKQSSRETKFAMSSTMQWDRRCANGGFLFFWMQEARWLATAVASNNWTNQKARSFVRLARDWILFQRVIWRQLQGIWRLPWLCGKDI